MLEGVLHFFFSTVIQSIQEKPSVKDKMKKKSKK